MSRAVAILATLVVGGLVAAQPPANQLLARHVNTLGAAFVSLATSVLIVGVLLVVAGDPGALTRIGQLRPVYLIGGVAGAAVVTVSLLAVKSLGAGGVTATLVATQLTVSVVLDRLGVLGLEGHPISVRRLAGMAFLFLGTLLVVTEP
ncbi:MAG: bacterial/archaeal transporter family-2 protein [Thermoleophilaceae bacterium]|jgi:transporter family-2 protein|nr:bacterial/archaeal transporter family-2 protein [Thermoleophilaceae bacterium]